MNELFVYIQEAGQHGRVWGPVMGDMFVGWEAFGSHCTRVDYHADVFLSTHLVNMVESRNKKNTINSHCPNSRPNWKYRDFNWNIWKFFYPPVVVIDLNKNKRNLIYINQRSSIKINRRCSAEYGYSIFTKKKKKKKKILNIVTRENYQHKSLLINSHRGWCWLWVGESEKSIGCNLERL